MKRKASSVLLIATFLVVLFSPHVLWPFFQDALDVNIEKRELAEKPTFLLGEIEAYPKAYEEYYDDHLPFRNQLIRMYNTILYRVFRTSSDENVIVGKEGWLFYKSRTDGTTLECYDGSMLFEDADFERMRVSLTGARDRLAEQGIEFVVFIAPDKERFYSEYMPDYYGEQAEPCMLTQALDYLRNDLGIRVVYPYEEMRAYQAAHPQQNLYYMTDTHWNEIAGYIGSRALLKELGIDIPPVEEHGLASWEWNEGDLRNMLNADGISETVFSPVIHTASGDVPQILHGNVDGITAHKMQEAPEKKVLMKRDSFAGAMIPCLSRNLSKLMTVHYSQFQPELIWEEKPDVFVLEIVERYICWLRNEVL